MDKQIKVILVLFFTLASYGFSYSQTQNSALFNLFGSAKKTTETKVPATTQVNNPEEKKENAKPDSLKRKSNEVESSEADLRKLEIKKKQIVLERELAELKSSGIVTKQDTINLEIKSKNLYLLYLKEQLLLKDELKNMGGLQEFGKSSIFGHHFFRDGGIRYFQKASDATPSSAYLLGPEDKLHLEVWGYSSISTDIEIGPDGYASLPMGQKLYLRGISLGNAKKLISRKLGSLVNLNNSSIDISIIKYRTITVHIVGEVIKSGSYVIPAINTAFNALTVMGGPSDIGSVRNIFIKRGGKIIDTLDAYDYMMNPKKSREVYLQDNDYIIVDPIGKIVTINGAIKRPGSYELKEGEKLSDLINIAAGIHTNTYLEDVLVSRIRDNKYFEKLALNYDSLLKSNLSFELLNGDNINFKSILDDTYQIVNINGAVNIPGSYKLKQGSSLKELIAQANGLLKEAFLDEAYLIRTDKDFTKSYYSFSLKNVLAGEKIIIQPRDEIYIFSQKDYLERGRLTIKGSVRGETSIPFTKGLTIRDLVFVAKGIKPESYLERGILTRTNTATNEKQTLVFNLSEILDNPSSTSNYLLEINDEIEVFSKIKFREKFNVTINGEIHSPGDYDYSEKLSLKDIIMKAGGIANSATDSKIEIVRLFEPLSGNDHLTPIPAKIINYTVTDVLNLPAEFSSIYLNPFDQIYIRKNPHYREQKIVNLTGAVFYPGEYTLISDDEKLSSLIKRAGGLRSYAFKEGIDFTRTEGYDKEVKIITNLNKALKKPNSNYNYTLRDKDVIFIPIATKLVSMTGYLKTEAKDNLSVFYKKHKRAKHYIKKYAGGFEYDTRKKDTYVKYADGRIKKTKNFLLFKCYPKPKPGSEIVVVKKNKRKRRGGNGQGFDKLSEKVSTLLGLMLMYAIVQQSFK